MQMLWARATFTLCGWGLCPVVPALVQRALIHSLLWAGALGLLGSLL